MTPPQEANKDGTNRPLVELIRGSFVHTRRTLGLVWRSSPALTSTLAALTAIAALAPLGVAWAGKRIVDAVVARSTEATLRWVLVELVLVAILAITQRGLSFVRTVLGARLGIDVNVAILEKSLSLDLRFFEDSEFYDKLTRARREASSRPVSLVTDTFALAQNVVTLAGYTALLVQFSPWVAAGLLLATVPATIAEIRYARLAFRVRNWRSQDSRRLLYLEYVLANDEHAKEIKLFGLGPMLLERYRALAEQFYAEDKKLAARRTALTQALSFLGTFAFYGAYAAMALRAAAGALTLGTMTLYLVAFRQGQQAFQSILGAIGSLYEHNLYMSNLFEYLAVAGARSTRTGTGTGTCTFTGAIDFRDVGFRYPGKDEWALRHIDLTIAGGESLALVGENGAGKTTLIKLLTRLYEPTEGSIALDGKDLREWDPELLRKRFGVVFQDFNQYQLHARENVAFGSVDHREDAERIARAVDRGGATELVSQLKSGLDTQLGTWFKGGTELSGGQWQKIALARAFMREEAGVLVLDEPTAALDANAEYEVFRRFRELAKGRTTIVISHRFPTVRMASRIVVLEHGRIVEQGSHDDLVKLGGRYATMFERQAEGYR